MQIIHLPKGIYKAYSYAMSKNVFHEFRNRYSEAVSQWETLHAHRVPVREISKICRFSRATYYRKRKILRQLDEGIIPPPPKKRVSQRQWGGTEIAMVLQIRREAWGSTYGKAKIAVILKRDHGFTMSESTVGRILKYLMERQRKITKSISATKQKRRRSFTSHAKPLKFKKYEQMEIGDYGRTSRAEAKMLPPRLHDIDHTCK